MFQLQEGGGDKQKTAFILSAAAVLMSKMLVFDYSERATTKFGAADGQSTYLSFESLQPLRKQRP